MENKQHNIRYREAAKRVKRLKGFYIHLLVYCFVNIFIMIAKALSLDPDEKFWEWNLLTVPFFWGIGIAAHGLSIFLPSVFLGSSWEEKKIRKIMEKNKK